MRPPPQPPAVPGGPLTRMARGVAEGSCQMLGVLDQAPAWSNLFRVQGPSQGVRGAWKDSGFCSELRFEEVVVVVGMPSSRPSLEVTDGLGAKGRMS